MIPQEGSQEYFNLNRDKVNEDDIESWKYTPFGTSKRKYYDYYYKPLGEFLERYYVVFERQEHWDNWFSGIIMLAYNKEYDKFRAIMDGVANWFDYDAMHVFREKLKLEKDFDDDILFFISYMNGEGFFKSINLNYENWILVKDFDRRDLTRFQKEWVEENKLNKSHQIDRYSLKEIASLPYGMNLVREKLMNLGYWKR
jgi:hypothetical protein